MPASQVVSPFLPEMHRSLHCMAEMYEWECKNMPFMKSSSGRSLYYALLHQCSVHPTRTRFPFKTLTTHLTDKALRIRMHEFAQLDLLTFDNNNEDGRARTVTPTPKLMTLFQSHSEAMCEVFQRRFMIFRKE